MKRLFCLMLVGVLASQDSFANESHQPKVKKPFQLNYYDVRQNIYKETNMTGNVMVEFIIDKDGTVIEPEIVDTFNVSFNEVILDKVRQMKFSPPIQNGVPVRVRYKLPITFK